MLNVEKINWEKIFHGDWKYYKLYQPTAEGIRIVSQKLFEDYLYLPDEHRSPDSIANIIIRFFPPIKTSDQPLHLFYEIGDFEGLLGFISIIPEYKGELIFKPWGLRKLFNGMKGREFIKESKELINFIIDEFKLRRLESWSPDKRILRMAKMVGFKQEGAQKNAFRWNGKLFTNFALSITRD